MPQLFYGMLAKFEGSCLLGLMEKIAEAVNSMNYLEIKNEAHSLKSAAGYVGASHIHYACYYI